MALTIVAIVAISIYLMLPWIERVHTSITATPSINPSMLNVELDISTEKGMKDFGEIALIDIKKPDVLRFKLIDWDIRGLQSLSLSAKVHLVSKGANYSINMPCILCFNASCTRVTVIIPGYDVPLRIEPGNYSLRLEVYWFEAKHSGKVRLSISMRAYNASIISLGYEIPKNTTNWIMAEGSTRSYALLVDKTETLAEVSGYGEFIAYVWVFAPFQEDIKIFKFNMESLETGKVEHHLEIAVNKVNGTYSTMLLIKAVPGLYRFSITQPIKLSIDLKVKAS